MLPVPAGAVEAYGSGARSLLSYATVAERLGALVEEHRTDVASARHALALAFVLAGRLPRQLEFGRRVANTIAFDPLAPDVLYQLGVRSDTAVQAARALEATGVLWPDDTGRTTLAADVLVPAALDAAERGALPTLLDVHDISARLDAVIPLTTRGTRERKATAWFAVAAIAAGSVSQEWVPLSASAFRPPLACDASGVTKALTSCVEAGVLERHQRAGETARYRFPSPMAQATQPIPPLSAPTTAAATTSAPAPDAIACVVEIHGARINLVHGAELTVDASQPCRITRDANGVTRVIIE